MKRLKNTVVIGLILVIVLFSFTACNGSSYYIRVETKDAVNTSGGYMAGYDKDSESVRFAEAKEMITNAIKGLK